MPSSDRLVALTLLGTLTACGGGPEPAPERPAALGGTVAAPSSTPTEPMNRLERPVASRLAPSLEEEGLTLEYVDCPRWAGSLPAILECKGYVDGVVGEVDVELTKADGGGVEFDAWLDHGVVATTRLVARLEQDGFTDVNCGHAPAYPARPGLRIVCRVEEGGEVSHVVATVTRRDGAVRIEDY